ncbi:hypothetical protein GCM10011491_10250 [Brucella endophytica]|uniref:Uncharacterized protein n=1 Tax=Brucella endophytica TaxID=1963359 RepID=A0A916WC89_9HYPH|nr:hypothetical protein [Brucella endophytica]GGA84657.1 hypothetical protein GCM10011491_10250 [Brucella endophytica]
MKLISALSVCLYFLPASYAFAEEPASRPLLLTDDYNNICEGQFTGFSAGFVTAVAAAPWGNGQFYINFKANKDQNTYVYMGQSGLDTAFGKAAYAAALQANAIGTPALVYCTGTTDRSGNPYIADILFGATTSEPNIND